MIKVGTLCYLTGDHIHAGRCCTVTCVAHYAPVKLTYPDCVQRETVPLVYGISIPGLPDDDDGVRGAFPRHLIPIAPPSPAIDLAQSEHARRLRKMGAPA